MGRQGLDFKVDTKKILKRNKDIKIYATETNIKKNTGKKRKIQGTKIFEIIKIEYRKCTAGVIKLLNGWSSKSACAVLPASSPENKKYMKSWKRERKAATLIQQRVQQQGEVIHLEEMNIRKIIESPHHS